MEKIWMNQKLRQLGLGFLYMVGGTIGIIIFYKLVDQPFNLIEIIVSGAIIIVLMLGVIKIILEARHLIIGPPKAGKTPEETVKKFFKSVLVAHGTLDLGGVRSDAMFIVSPKGLEKINGWDEFKEYWVEQNNLILNKLANNCSPTPITKTLFKLKEIFKVGDDTQEQAIRKIIVDYTAISGLGTTLNPEKQLGTWTFESVCKLEKNDQLWYITDSKMKLL